jgi:hypothetical protein
MAEQQKNEGTADKGKILVKAGAREVRWDGAGQTIADVRTALGKVFNLDATQRAYVSVGGKKPELILGDKEGAYVIPEGAELTFIKEAGAKG